MDMENMHKKLIGHVTVSEGRLLLIDPYHLDQWDSGEFDEDESTFPTYSYEEACKAVIDDKGYGQVFRGMATACHLDGKKGVFPLYGYFDKDDRICKIEMDFLNPEK